MLHDGPSSYSSAVRPSPNKTCQVKLFRDSVRAFHFFPHNFLQADFSGAPSVPPQWAGHAEPLTPSEGVDNHGAGGDSCPIATKKELKCLKQGLTQNIHQSMTPAQQEDSWEYFGPVRPQSALLDCLWSHEMTWDEFFSLTWLD